VSSTKVVASTHAAKSDWIQKIRAPGCGDLRFVCRWCFSVARSGANADTAAADQKVKEFLLAKDPLDASRGFPVTAKAVGEATFWRVRGRTRTVPTSLQRQSAL